MAITLRDIANQAGVSIKTVSRVLNDEPHVRQEVRQHVQDIIKKLDYTPNIFARGLSSSKSYVISLFSDAPAWSHYVSRIEREALLRCRAKGYHLVVEPLDLAAPDCMRRIEASYAKIAYDGVILVPPACDSLPILAFLETKGIPYVRISPGRYRGRSGFVEIDEIGSSKAMCRYLLSLGHVGIAFIGGLRTHLSAAKRKSGFLSGMQEAGANVREDFILEGDFTFASGFECGHRLLTQSVRPTAIFAANDDMALGVVAAISRNKLTMPDDISVAGFDDTPSAKACWPAITTIRQPIDELASTAVDIVTNPRYRDDQMSPEFQRALAFELVPRGSTARRQSP